MDITTSLAGIELENPVVLASGTAGYGTEIAPIIDVSRLGGIVLKTVTLAPCPGNREPRIWETTAGMLNSIGLENVGADALAEDILPSLGEYEIPIIASIAGETVREYAKLAARLSSSEVLSGLEVNVSCPNVEKGGIHFGADPGATRAVVRAVRENTGLPVLVKLSAAVSDISAVALAAGKAGASGLSVTNTIPGMAVDHIARRPRLGGVTGGLSGPAIKPIALKAVWDCQRASGLPILGGGGIFDAVDVLEFMVAGASAVALGTSLYQDPLRPLEIIDSLPAAVERAGAASVRALIGTLET